MGAWYNAHVSLAKDALLKAIRSWDDYHTHINYIDDAFPQVLEALWQEVGAKRDIFRELDIAKMRVRDLEEEIDRENLAGQFADNREHSKPVISDGSPF